MPAKASTPKTSAETNGTVEPTPPTPPTPPTLPGARVVGEGEIVLSRSTWKMIRAVLLKQPYETVLPIFDALDDEV